MSDTLPSQAEKALIAKRTTELRESKASGTATSLDELKRELGYQQCKDSKDDVQRNPT
ncbi:hypothetical protein [Thalassomonas haliotis]|uniref:Uncharacterized protein n=1 Tax=Thalassomonas haliotis TaxID=485448 RepID=A0ABY7VG04_9GAMM|nr:hypothetical protein [Thalassomonas haliotis]WDE12336.1 hypothetical protein H3N35_02290 [Thalassomonas haliotis]